MVRSFAKQGWPQNEAVGLKELQQPAWGAFPSAEGSDAVVIPDLVSMSWLLASCIPSGMRRKREVFWEEECRLHEMVQNSLKEGAAETGQGFSWWLQNIAMSGVWQMGRGLCGLNLLPQKESVQAFNHPIVQR